MTDTQILTTLAVWAVSLTSMWKLGATQGATIGSKIGTEAGWKEGFLAGGTTMLKQLADKGIIEVDDKGNITKGKEDGFE